MVALEVTPTSPESLWSLRRMEAEAVVDTYARFTRDEFSGAEAQPVVICARNEEDDLPATLVSLARSTIDVLPVVVANNCVDRTASFARKMGAVVIEERAAGKLHATQSALDVLSEEGYRQVLFTDADALVGKRWAAHMLQRTIEASNGAAMITGPCVFEHGPSLVIDALRTANVLAKDSWRKLTASRPIARGVNYGLQLDYEGVTLAAIAELPGNLFPGEEEAIGDCVLTADGTIESTVHRDSLVLSRGDRFSSLGECVLIRLGLKPRVDQYTHDYGTNLIPYQRTPQN